jgi:hypothetical protein
MERNNNRFCLIMVLAAMLLIPLAGTDGYAQDVNAGSNANGSVLFVPGYIVGNVSFGGEPVANAAVTTSASSYFPSAGVTTDSSGNYKVMVGTPDGGSCNYTVSCNAYTDNGKDFLIFKGQNITVSDGGTSTLNFHLIPGYIQGKVTINGSAFSGGQIYAELSSGEKYSYARTTFSSDGAFSFPVQANENIRVYGYVTANGYSYNLESQYISVAEGGTKTVNFSLNMGCISGKVSLSGGTLSSGYVRANGNEQCSLASDGSFSLKVLTGENIRVSGAVYASNGNCLKYFGLENKNVTVTVGTACAVTNWTLSVSQDCPYVPPPPPPPVPGSLSGTFTLQGFEGKLDRHYIRFYGRSSWREATLTANGGAYSFTNLSAGDYTVYNAESYLNNGDDYLRHPDTSYDKTATVVSDQDTKDDVLSQAAFVNGKVILEGTNTVGDVTWGRVSAYGVAGTPANYGYARDTLNAETGKYDLVLTEGDWEVASLVELQFSHATIKLCDDLVDKYLNSSMTITDYTRKASMKGEVSLDGGQVIDDENLVYQTGTVTIKFRVKGGGTLRSPALSGYCNVYDDSGNLETKTEIAAYGSSAEATEHEVIFIGTPGSYNLTATAVVGGITVTFGKVSVEVEGGVCKTFEPGAPKLNIKTPKSGYSTCGESVVVAGVVTIPDIEGNENSKVAGVTVNGESVTLTSANNPDDPKEMSFTTTVQLAKGANAIKILASNTLNDKVASDTRTVYRYAAGVFGVGDDPVKINWLYDGGYYQGELGIFSLSEMDKFVPNSKEFVMEAAKRVLSNTGDGYVVFSDPEEGAQFRGSLGEAKEWNTGEYKGVKSFDMRPGDTFATMLVPNYTFEKLYNDLSEGVPLTVERYPLFSLASYNEDHGMYLGQIADINGKGNAFIYEDINFKDSDRDYNDLIFQIAGAYTCQDKAPTLDSLIAAGIMSSEDDWRVHTDLGKQVMDQVNVEYSSKQMSVSAEGAADLYIYDQDGKECGKEGSYIPGAESKSDENGNQLIRLSALKPGNYRLVLRGKESGGNCTLTVKIHQDESEISSDVRNAGIRFRQILKADIVLGSDLRISSFGEFESPTDDRGKPLVYDFDGDGKTDESDIAKVSSRWNAEAGDENYDVFYDLDDDGYIGILDIMPVVNENRQNY